MHSQKPSWRWARSSPSAARRSSGSRSSTLSRVADSRARPAEAEEAAVDPVLGARLLAEARHAARRASSSVTPNCSSGRTTVIVASAPWRRGRRAARRGRCRRGRRRRSRRSSASPPSSGSSSLMRPPVGVSRPVSTHSTSTPAGPGLGRGELARSARPCSRWRAGSAEALRGVEPDHVPDDRHARRSRRAAWGSPACAPAGACRARRRGSRRAAAGARSVSRATRSSTSAGTSKFACTALDVVVLFEHLDQPHQRARLGLVDRHEARRPVGHLGALHLDARLLQRRAHAR